MKRNKILGLLKTTCALLIIVQLMAGCNKDFLDAHPYGQFSDEEIANKQGIEALLIGAYGTLTSHTLYRTGGLSGDDAHKGSNANDTPPLSDVEAHRATEANNEFYTIWVYFYDGIARANRVINLANNKEIKDLTTAEIENAIGQARFLRGHFHFQALQNFSKVPYISETTTDTYDNTTDIWPAVEEDFKYAYEKLPETQDLKAKANKWAAACYLAKVYLYQHKYPEAKLIFDEIMRNGKTSTGLKYDLQDAYWKNFDPNFEFSKEDVFSVSNAASGTVDGRGAGVGSGTIRNAYPYGGPFTCCGFYQPSQNLVNAFKTDANGLPMLYNFDESDVKNDEGIFSDQPFTPEQGNLDSRLDWTVGRRGIYYWDFGPHAGSSWIRDQVYGGPYSPKKHVYANKDANTLTSSGNNRITAKNFSIIRFDDVLLMAAEAEVEAGDLDVARGYVNKVRARAADPVSWVRSNIATGDPADANYVVGLYNDSWTDQGMARDAVRFERRLEFAMEEYRFYDLVRWGIADQVLNKYLTKERVRRTYLNGAVFTKDKDEYFPIPLRILDLAENNGSKLTQNKGY